MQFTPILGDVIPQAFDSMRYGNGRSENLPNAVLLSYPDSGHGSGFQLHESFTRQATALPRLPVGLRPIKLKLISAQRQGSGAKIWRVRPHRNFRRVPLCRKSSGNANKGLAEVPAGQHVDERARGRRQALGDIVPVADFAGPDQRAYLPQETIVMLGGELGAIPATDRYGNLKEIKRRTLVVNGKNDIMVPTINSYILQQQLPDARLILYPDSGHGSHFQFSEEFAEEAARFFAAA
jgi:pimeloyl-ACP methyl ester carboxylesterase